MNKIKGCFFFFNLLGYAPKPNNTSHINREIIGAISKIRDKTKMLPSPLLFSKVLGVIKNTMKKEKR